MGAVAIGVGANILLAVLMEWLAHREKESTNQAVSLGQHLNQEAVARAAANISSQQQQRELNQNRFAKLFNPKDALSVGQLVSSGALDDVAQRSTGLVDYISKQTGVPPEVLRAKSDPIRLNSLDDLSKLYGGSDAR